MSRALTLGELASLADAKIVGDAGLAIDRVSAVEEASAGALTFAIDARWAEKALQSTASAVIVPPALADIKRGEKTLVLADDVRAALASILKAFAPPLPSGDFTHPSASIADGVIRGAGVWIGAGVIVCEDAHLGDHSVLLPGSFVGRSAKIGKRTLMHPRATLLDGCVVGEDCVLHSGSVIGSDGFGFVRVGLEQLKIPQIGNVVLGDRVEVGACACIDRAVTGSTLVGTGTKIDNLVQIGHNVQIGEHCVLCGQVGIAGSAKIGRGTTAAGQAGIAGHLTVGEYSLVLAQAGVTHSIPAHSRVVGFPAQPYREYMEQKVITRRLPKIIDQVRTLTETVEEIRKRQ